MSDQETPAPETTTETPETPTTTTAPEPQAEPTSLLSEPVEAPFDPEKLTLPDGFEKNETFEQFTNLAREISLTGPQAQKLIELHASTAKAAYEQQAAAWQAQNEKWQEEVKADKEIGGLELEKVRQTFAKVADNPELTDPEFRNALNFTGAGNHPAIIRTLARWAKALSEGAPVQGEAPARNAQGKLVNEPRNLAEIFYGRE